MFFVVVSVVAFLLATTHAQSPPCTARGKSGRCINENTCTGDVVASSAGANGCQAFPAAIKCCIAKAAAPPSGGGSGGLPAGPTCVAYGRAGTCVSSCPAPFRHSSSLAGSVEGCERFPAAVKCCSPGTPPNGGGGGGGNDPSPNDNAEIPQAALDIIKRFEGFFARAYPDPLSGGKPITIGWGSTRKLDGSPFRLGETVTRDQAENLLRHELQTTCLPQLKKLPTWSRMNSNQRSALLSFSYNLGAYWPTASGFRTLQTVVRNGQWSKIRSALLLYVNPGTSVTAGLTRRRNAEADLFLKPVTNSAGLLDDPIPQVPLDPSEDVDSLDPSLHSTNEVAIGVGVAIAVLVVALIVAAVVWVCVNKRKQAVVASDGGAPITMKQTYKSSYTCNFCKTTFFSGDDLASHVQTAHA